MFSINHHSTCEMGLPKARPEMRNCVQIDYLGGDPRKHKADGGKRETGR